MSGILIVALILTIVFAQSNLIEKHKKEKDFLDFSKKYYKKYTSTEETLYRFSVFKDNLKRLDDLRANHPNVQFELNHMFDITHEEFQVMFTGVKPELDEIQPEIPRNLESVRTLETTPLSYDLREAVGVIPIRDQKTCGSSHVFSALASVEYAYWKKYGTRLDFSEQQYIDCDKYSFGCSGGLATYVFSYIQLKGIALEEDYTYQAVKGTCKESSVTKYAYTSNPPYGLVNPTDESIKLALIKYGALSACADSRGWQFYKSGVFANNNPLYLQCNQSVTIVGYGLSENGYLYYIIRNSWGQYWGENGYIRLEAVKHPDGKYYGGLIYQNIYYTNIQ